MIRKNKLTLKRCGWLSGIVGFCALAGAVIAAPETGRDVLEVFTRAARGEPLRYVALGGSITQASGPGWVGNWFKEQFPESEVTTINSGMSSTGSALGVFRIERDVIAHRPDLVAIEFCVNDGGLTDDEAVRYMESMIVRLKSLPDPPAIVILESAAKTGANIARHRRVAAHYGLLEVDLQDAVDRHLATTGAEWASLFHDPVHPKAAGNTFYADVIKKSLQPLVDEAREAAHRDRNASTKPVALPARLSAEPLLLDGRIVPLTDLKADLKSDGWRDEALTAGWWRRFFNGVLVADAPGSVLEIPFRGTTAGIYYAMARDYGTFYVNVDGGQPEHVSTNSRDGYSFVVVAEGLAAREHRLRIVLPPSSEGRVNGPVKLGYLLVAGETGASHASSSEGWFDVATLKRLRFEPLMASRWSWAGPFPVPMAADGRAPIDAKRAMVTRFVAEPGDEGKGPEAAWRKVTSDSVRVDFRVLTGLKDPAVAYAKADWQSERGGAAVLSLTVDYFAHLWLNGKRILTLDGPHRVPVFVPVELRPGNNEFVIKAGSGTGGFNFLLKVAEVPPAAEVQRGGVENVGSLHALLPSIDKWHAQTGSAPDVPPDPARWNEPGARSGKQDSVWYEVPFTCPVGWAADGRRVSLDFERIEGDVIVFINGRKAAELLAPGGEIEITSLISSEAGATNTLRVFNTRTYAGISRGFEQDVLRHVARTGREALPPETWPRGITAPVTLRSRPAQAITDVFVLPSWRGKELGVEVEVDCAAPVDDVVVSVVIRDPLGREVLVINGIPVSLQAGRTVQRLSSRWADPVPWELEKPFLYRAEVNLVRAGKVVNTHPSVTFGFREVWTEGRDLILNGHPIRFRLTDLYGASANALSFYRLMGYNAGQIQPHPNLWWRNWHDTPLLDTDLIDEADRQGFALTAPAPGITHLGPVLLGDRMLRDAYEREVRRFTRKYRNHPSILVWAMGMNSYNPQSNIHPATLGRREAAPPERGRVITAACDIVRSADPTRLVFSHADGSLGDISSANVYLNFAPLQEREEWPLAWARDGDMPYAAAEFGQPFTANFWKGRQFLITEYLALYLGERAYERETAKGLESLVGLGLANTSGFGSWPSVDLADFPAYWEFQDIFINHTNRAWRMWGVNAGWLHWLLDVGYGNPPGVANPGYLNRYKQLPAPLTAKPAWANPNFDIHARSNQPFLAYIAGGEVHTDKTHAFYAGEHFQKQIAVVWDGAVPKTVTLGWTLSAGGKQTMHGREEVTLTPGQIAFFPLSLIAPQENAELSLRVTEEGREIATDAFALQVFPRLQPLDLGGLKVALHDPAGKSDPWLRQLGVRPITWKEGMTLAGFDVLLIGREALNAGEPLPYTVADIARGLRVLILEQPPSSWEMLGFETEETLSRYTFAADRNGPVLAGLRAEDLINWRGSPDLLPEGRHVKAYDNLRAPHWTNRHAVASVVLKIPEVVGFTPILKTEFDLAYSPLLEWRHGRGVVYFSSLDFTGRVGIDPVATHLARNLLQAVAGPLESRRQVFFSGVPEDEALLRTLHVDLTSGEPRGGAGRLLVLGENGGSLPPAQLNDFLESGGTILRLPQSAGTLRQSGLAAELRTIVQARGTTSVSVLRAVGPELLRWRDTLSVQTFSHGAQPEGTEVLAGGIALQRPRGAGREVWLQVSPAMLARRHHDDPEKREAVQLSVSRLHRLVAQIMTNLGATSSPAVASRVCSIERSNTFRPIASWHALGPWPVGETDPKTLLGAPSPGEAEAIAGDDNPNTVYRRDDGASLDWRKVVHASADGFVDFARDLGAGEHSVVYAQRKIISETNRLVRMRLGADYWLKFWINGRVALTVHEGHGAPKPAAFIIDVPLRKGENVLTIKAAGGSKGFGFWADIEEGGASDATSTADTTSGQPSRVRLYQPLFKPADPYQFHYW